MSSTALLRYKGTLNFKCVKSQIMGVQNGARILRLLVHFDFDECYPGLYAFFFSFEE